MRLWEACERDLDTRTVLKSLTVDDNLLVRGRLRSILTAGSHPSWARRGMGTSLCGRGARTVAGEGLRIEDVSVTDHERMIIAGRRRATGAPAREASEPASRPT